MKISAFIDESGDPHFNPNASELLVYTCVLLPTSDLDNARLQIAEIQNRYGLKEFKSSKIDDETRRLNIIKDLASLKFKYLHLVFDKGKIIGKWRNYFRTFYKFTQKLLHKELHRLFQGLKITIDKYGDEKYQKSLELYLEREIQLSLFDNGLYISSAKSDVLIQVADIIGGTIRKLEMGEFNQKEQFESILSLNTLAKMKWPDNFPRLNLEEINNEKDKLVAKLCIECAESFVEINKDIPEKKQAVAIAEYLLFNAIHVDPFGYVYRVELTNWLSANKHTCTPDECRTFIALLRDSGVVIAGSQIGYKIPLTEAELIDHLQFSVGRSVKSIQRNKKSLEVLKAKSLGDYDLISYKVFSPYQKLFETI